MLKSDRKYWQLATVIMDKLDELIRKPAVAGQFYDANPAVLDADLSAFFANCADVEPLTNQKMVRAIISPHAGYIYSGQTAAKVFNLLKQNFNSTSGFNSSMLAARSLIYKRAVVIAPSHRMPFLGLASSTYTAYRTPLGDIPVDRDVSEQLALSPVISINNAAHDGEHALEVQLPFLQKILETSPMAEDFKIVPLICGSLDDKTAKLAAEALLPYWNQETLWIISSDFTHYGRSFGYLPFSENVPEELKKLDLGAVDAIEKLDYAAFDEYITKTGATICGANPIKLLLKTIELSTQDDNITAQLVDYTNSGELTDDYSSCVSYAGIAFFND